MRRRSLQPNIVADPTPDPDLSGTFQADASVTLFGFDATRARVRLLPRSRAWRLRGVIPIVLVTLVLAPIVGVIPPHAPWILAVVVGGTLLARRRWKWRYTLTAVEGTCPRCGAELHVRPGRLRDPHTLSCEACRNDIVLKLPPEVLEAHASEAA
jgi:hypothetical protein